MVLWRKKNEKTQIKTATNDENVINILAAVQLNPTISTKQLERECKFSKKSILRILHESKLHPNQIHLHKNSKVLIVSCMNFYNIMLRMINEDLTFLSRVLFSD